MAEYVPPPKTLFSVKVVNNQYVVVSDDEGDNAVQEGIRDSNLFFTNLNSFQRALAHVNEQAYDNDIISQLLLSNTRLALCVPNRRIKELEVGLAPLLHQQATYQFILGAETDDTDEPDQPGTNNAPGKVCLFYK